MCDKVILKISGTLESVPDRYKSHENYKYVYAM